MQRQNALIQAPDARRDGPRPPITDAAGQGGLRRAEEPGRRQGVPRPPHPGREGRRGQGDHRAAEERRQVRGARQEVARTRAQAPTAATSTGPAPTATSSRSADAMVKLEKGKITEAPVQTQFGWHVIRLDDMREAQFPPLEQVQRPDPRDAAAAEGRGLRRAASQGREDSVASAAPSIRTARHGALCSFLRVRTGTRCAQRA
ncbi:MAG: peptidyl-prolyl cis-trans isomerase [Comamonadaceae bacterium]|nr:peptidyl-prolyl cis-trans isomerase [Comamonadaceae bacterium]